MKSFLTTCANIFQFTSGAKIATVIAIYLKFITPPTFPFFQAHWLLAIAVVEIIITLILSSGNLSGRTNIFITPGYEWKIVDVMLTNFHLPKTSLLLMIESFVGKRWRQLYATAIEMEYRFLSFGDAMLISREKN
jgi:hypothetical protein